MLDYLDKFDNIMVEFSAEYLSKSLTLLLILGAVATAFTVATILRTRKLVGIGIANSIFQFLSCLAMHSLPIVIFTNEFIFKKVYYINGYNNYGVTGQMEREMDEFLANSFVARLQLTFLGVIFLGSLIFGLIFFVQNFQYSHKGFSVFGFVVYLLRLIIGVVGAIFLVLKSQEITGEMIQDCLFRLNGIKAGLLCLSLLLLFMGALMKQQVRISVSTSVVQTTSEVKKETDIVDNE